jgi:hypothetical protein
VAREEITKTTLPQWLSIGRRQDVALTATLTISENCRIIPTAARALDFYGTVIKAKGAFVAKFAAVSPTKTPKLPRRGGSPMGEVSQNAGTDLANITNSHRPFDKGIVRN